MATLRDDVRSTYREHLQGRKNRDKSKTFTYTEAIPGSEEKILVLEARAAQGLPLHHPYDAVLTDDEGWFIRVGPNGRIIEMDHAIKQLAGLYEKIQSEAQRPAHKHKRQAHKPSDCPFAA